MYVTATDLTTHAQAWTKNYATNTCGNMGHCVTSDYWRFVATGDGKYIYYVRNAGLTQLHIDNIATGDQIASLPLAVLSDPLMAYSNNYVYIAGAKEQMKIDATTGAIVWRKTTSFSSDSGYTITQNNPAGQPFLDAAYRPVVLTNDTMWWVDGSTTNSGHLIGMSTADGTIVQNIDLAAMVIAKNPNERLIAVNDVMDANGKLGVLLDIGDVTDPHYTDGSNKIKYQDLYLFGSRLPGDANSDDKVTFADYILLELNFGYSGSWAQGDFNGDGIVNFKDYIILEANFGKSVPEPATASLLAASGLTILRGRK